MLPTREAHIHCTLSFAIAPIVITQLISFMSHVTVKRVALMRKCQLFLLSWLARLLIVQRFVPLSASAAPAVPVFLSLPCTCTDLRGWLHLFPNSCSLAIQTCISYLASSRTHYTCCSGSCLRTAHQHSSILLLGRALSPQAASVCFSFVHVCHEKRGCCFRERKAMFVLLVCLCERCGRPFVLYNRL